MRLTLFLIFTFLTTVCLHSQKLVVQAVEAQKSAIGDFEKKTIFEFTPTDFGKRSNELEGMQKASLLKPNLNSFTSIIESSPAQMELQIPTSANTFLALELIEYDLFSPNFVHSTASGASFPYEGGKHYKGIVKGDNNSVVAISVFENEVMGLISTAKGNRVLGKLQESTTNEHILYFDSNLPEPIDFDCEMEDDGIGYKPKDLKYVPKQSRDQGDCVKLYIEIDDDIVIEKGGVTNATNYVVGLFGQSIVLYDNEDILMSINEIKAWDVPSPYNSSSSSGMLNAFQANINAINGDLGHLVSYKASGGIAAGFSGICANNVDDQLCFSSIGTTYSNVPTYSYSVMVTTHEMGHLIGSRHTHACVWNGNNTAIDGCSGFTEGGCPLPGDPAAGGTIMSYCHVSPVGINFNLGFGPQPGNVIRNTVNEPGNCLGTCGAPSCEDGIQNGDETGVDCGGAECPACPTCDDGIQNGSETGVDCGGPECEPCPCLGVELELTIVFDQYENETTWDIQDDNGNVLASGGPYSGQPTGSSIVEDICIDSGCYDFTIYDSYGDGICCAYGIGSYSLAEDGTVLASGGEFGSSETTAFCTGQSSSCDDGIQNGSETGVDCGGPDCPACPTCDDGIQNGSETGVDCGGPDCPACETCDDGIQNGSETGVDCGGPDCPACETCDDGIQNGSETGVDCGGPDCPACETCDDGIQNGSETGVDCGGPDCPACPTCDDGIQNGSETGVDCGGPDCPACETCDDGIQNGSETGVDCGGPDCPACETCDDGIQNGSETGVDCGGPDCPACPTCDDGIQNGNETGVDCGGPDCPACETCDDGIQNGDETGVDCGGPDCPACETCDDGIQNGDETGVDCGGSCPDVCDECEENVVTLTIVLDNYPEETSWEITDANNTVVGSGGTYGSSPDGSTIVAESCLIDGCYNFTIYDSYGDGICCQYGVGNYTLYDDDGNLLASGASFGSSESTDFCVGVIPDPVYCESSGNSTFYEYIDRVIFGNIDNASGDDGGYGDYTDMTIEASAGAPLAISVYPGFSGSSYTEYWNVWVDFNQDGDFDDANELLDSGSGAGPLFGNPTIPSDASLGETRLRVSMRYNSFPPSCGSFQYGEVEDYTINIQGGATIVTSDQGSSTSLRSIGEEVEPNNLRLSPNPTSELVNVEYISREGGQVNTYITDLTGRTVQFSTMQFGKGENKVRIDVSSLNSGIYMFKIVDGDFVSTQKLMVVE